jgi:pyruvate carboxylase subunit B
MKRFVEISGRKLEVELETDVASGTVLLNGQEVDFSWLKAESGAPASLILNGKSFTPELIQVDGVWRVGISGYDLEAIVSDGATLQAAGIGSSAKKSAHSGDVKAPMPGLIVKVEVEAGQVVQKGTGLLVIEAMKMENEIRASHSGTVAEIKVSPGQAVEKGQLLMVITT